MEGLPPMSNRVCFSHSPPPEWVSHCPLCRHGFKRQRPISLHHSQSTFHMWHTKHHSFPCSKTTSTDKALSSSISLRGQGMKRAGTTGRPLPPRDPHHGFTMSFALARPALPQSPDWRDSHMMFTGFCNHCNLRAHRTLLHQTPASENHLCLGYPRPTQPSA